MNKLLKMTVNTGLLMFFLGLLVVPIGSMGIVKVKTPSQGGVLSSKDASKEATVNTEEDLEEQIKRLEEELEKKDQELAEIEKALFEEAVEEGTQAISGNR
jgi:hypothetical protein